MTPDYGRANLFVSRALVDQLVQEGLRHAVISPGSRSTPLAVAFATYRGVRVWVLIDERSAGFFALGMARQLGEPVALLCTSGTAAANYLPAVAEADLSRIPLLVLTADRPPELRGWGAAQTIDQVALYGPRVRWFADFPVPDGDASLPHHARAAARRAMRAARGEPAGPVHLNLPFREPLLPPDLGVLDDLAASHDPCDCTKRTSHTLAPEETEIADLANVIMTRPRGIIVCGPEAPTMQPHGADVTALAAMSRYPILADPLSGLRFGPHDRDHIVDAYDLFLRSPAAAEHLAPDVVLRLGAIPTSKPLQQFLARSPADRHVILDAGPPRDPTHLATHHLQADPASTLRRLTHRIADLDPLPDAGWSTAWSECDATARHVLSNELAATEFAFEGRVLADVAARLSAGSTLMLGNSMPVRDADAFVRGDNRPLRFVSNRGANGIDGVVSSALGAASVAEGPVTLVIGDLSFYHDLTGLLAARRFGLRATIVVINNHGGGIFSFLPQAEILDPATFESLFGTPVDLSIEQSARLFMAYYERPTGWASFRRSLDEAETRDGLTIIEVITDRQENLERHRAINTRVIDKIERHLGARP